MRRLVARCAVLCGLLLVTVATAQPPAKVIPQPRVSAVFPVGAKAGVGVGEPAGGAGRADADVQVVLADIDADERFGARDDSPEIPPLRSRPGDSGGDPR